MFRGTMSMKKLISGTARLLALLASTPSFSNPASQISKLEIKLDRLSQYINANCYEDAPTPKCKRAETSIIRIDEKLERLKETVSVSLRTSASVATQGKKPSMLERQYDILQLRLEKIENFIERLEASSAPQKEAKLKGLHALGDLVWNRMLQLKTQMNG
jgi:hypothetical protein